MLTITLKCEPALRLAKYIASDVLQTESKSVCARESEGEREMRVLLHTTSVRRVEKAKNQSKEFLSE